MAIPRALGLVIIIGAGILGAFIGRAVRAVPNDAPGVQANASAPPAPSGTTPADEECEAERRALASTKEQLAICLTVDTTDPKTAPSGVPEKSEPNLPASSVQELLEEEIRTYQERLESLSEAVIVRHSGGTIRVYAPEEWPIDGDGLIIARKFKNGEIRDYAGPDAGPRSDPAAFTVRRRSAPR
jgi:hypothetical protein